MLCCGNQLHQKNLAGVFQWIHNRLCTASLEIMQIEHFRFWEFWNQKDLKSWENVWLGE